MFKPTKLPLFFSILSAVVLTIGGGVFAISKSPLMKASSEDTTHSDKGTTSTGERSEYASIIDAYRKAPEKPADNAIAPNGTGTNGMATMSQGPIMVPNAAAKIITEWPTGRNLVALTFDDGPHPSFTPRFMELLKSNNAKATFFLLGPMIEKSPGIVKELVANGFEVGNHTWDHLQLNHTTPDKINDQMARTNAAIKAAAGVDCKLLRPPYGQANKKVQQAADDQKLKIICWSVDPNDWRKDWTEDKMVQEVLKNTHDGSIILFHDKSEKTFNAVSKVIPALQQKGFQFVTVSELLGPAAISASTSASVTARAVPASVNSLPAPSATAPSSVAPPASTPQVKSQTPSVAPSGSLPAVSGDKVTQGKVPAVKTRRSR